MPPTAPAQGASAVGTTIQGPGTTNPDAPTASAGGPTPPPPAGPAGTLQPAENPGNGNPSSITNTALPTKAKTDSNQQSAADSKKTNDTGTSHPAPTLSTKGDEITPIEDKRHLTGTTRESVNHKLETYLLNPEHKIGGPKSKWFKEALGITRENAGHLANQLVFDPNSAIAMDKTQHGQKYEQIIHIHGTNGKIIPVNMVWIRNLDGVVRLVTAIPTKQKK